MAENTLKYHKEILELKLSVDCPPKNALTADLEAFRWTFKKIDHNENFLPVAILNARKNRPPRINSKDESVACSTLALSFFKSKEISINKFKSLPDRNKELLGYTHLSAGDLDSNDGLITMQSQSGHFDLHEFKKVDLSKKFKVLTRIE